MSNRAWYAWLLAYCVAFWVGLIVLVGAAIEGRL